MVLLIVVVVVVGLVSVLKLFWISNMFSVMLRLLICVVVRVWIKCVGCIVFSVVFFLGY